jgi:hypothetical protein
VLTRRRLPGANVYSYPVAATKTCASSAQAACAVPDSPCLPCELAGQVVHNRFQRFQEPIQRRVLPLL